MSRIDAINQYQAALRAGQKYYAARMAAHENPYPAVLEEQINETQASGHVQIGTIEIPSDQIVGTLAAGRKAAFAGNFMPLLPEHSEFGSKWISLCEAHLGDDGIHDPITCMEYMGKFYVMEGHKRASVLKSFNAPTIQATVTRVVPVWSEDPEVRAYYEFMKFFRLCGLYQVQFHRPGQYERLLGFMKLGWDHEWTKEEKSAFTSLFWRFRNVCDGKILEKIRDHSVSEALLGCLEVYPYEELRDDDSTELFRKITSLLPDLSFDTEKDDGTVSLTPEIGGKGFVRHLLDGIARPVLNIAFIYAASPEKSAWSLGHETGRQYTEQELGAQVVTRAYVAEADHEDDALEQAVQDQAQVIFVTAPTLLAPARRTAAKYPELKVLVCALSLPYTGVRTYYSRLYEAKFIAGAIAGTLCHGEPIGFVGRYPILGTPAAINAFALGARMTCPDAKVHLAWSCLPGDPVKTLLQAGCGIVSGNMTASVTAGNSPWGTSRLSQEGNAQVLISDVWNWGKLYVNIIRSILNGGWEDADDVSPAVNYWWGMNSGVMDVHVSPALPEGVQQLASILRTGLINGTIQPFLTRLTDQKGVVRSQGDRWFTPIELMNMNWLVDAVVGSIPAQEDLLERSRKTTSLLSIPKETEE